MIGVQRHLAGKRLHFRISDELGGRAIRPDGIQHAPNRSKLIDIFTLEIDRLTSLVPEIRIG